MQQVVTLRWHLSVESTCSNLIIKEPDPLSPKGHEFEQMNEDLVLLVNAKVLFKERIPIKYMNHCV
jgi:hypothetical protein